MSRIVLSLTRRLRMRPTIKNVESRSIGGITGSTMRNPLALGPEFPGLDQEAWSEFTPAWVVDAERPGFSGAARPRADSAARPRGSGPGAARRRPCSRLSSRGPVAGGGPALPRPDGGRAPAGTPRHPGDPRVSG